MRKKATEAKTKATTTTAVARTSTSVQPSDETLAMLAADAGAGIGTEGAGIESYAIPFLLILQKGSPQVDEASPDTIIPGAKAGMLFESVSNQLTDGKQGLLTVPCAYRRAFLRWSQDNAFKAELSPEEVLRRQEAKELVDIDGTLFCPDGKGKVDVETSDYITEVRNHYVLIVDEEAGSWRQALLSLKSTQIKKSRRLMTALVSVKMNVGGKIVTPATFANYVRLTTVAEANDKGTWFGWKMELEGFVKSPSLYAAAKEFHAAIINSRVEHNYQPEGKPQAKGF